MAHSLRNQLASLGTCLWARPQALSEIGELKACSRSLCDAPIDMRLCEENRAGLRQPTDRPLLPAALYCLMLYVFELMANASLNRGLASPIKEPRSFRDGQ